MGLTIQNRDISGDDLPHTIYSIKWYEKRVVSSIYGSGRQIG